MNMNVSVKLHWNFNIAEAPRDRKIIIATDKDKVFSSRWLTKEGRWEGFSKGRNPDAWMPWPAHPNAEVQA